MKDNEILLLRKLLKLKNRNDLAELLGGALGDVNESNQYGNYLNSVIASYEIYAPIDKYYSLKELKEQDKKIILDLILDIHPLEEGAPEIVDFNIRLLKEEDSHILSEDSAKDLPTKSIRVFVSYSTEDKVIAGQIKNSLHEFGLEVFLAHEDISPSLEWQDVILQNLESIDIFVPLLSSNFIQSSWTDQESGYALAKDKYIIPISLDDTNPYGFIGKYQTLRIATSQVYSGCLLIVKTICSNVKFTEAMINLLIKSFENSVSFDMAGIRSHLLSEAKKISKAQLDQIIKAAIENSQIRFSFKAREYLEILFNKHKQFVDKELLKKLNSSMDDFKYELK